MQTGRQSDMAGALSGIKKGPRSAPCAGSADVADHLILALYFLGMR